MAVIEITVNNWRKFNPKSDRSRNPHWFRVNKDLASSEALFSLSASQKWTWVCILGLCCRKDSETVKVNTGYLAEQAKVEENDVLQTIEILSLNGTLTVTCQSTDRNLSVKCQSTDSSLTLHNITVHTEHNITDIQTDRQSGEAALIDLVNIWNTFSGKLPKVRECGKGRRDKIKSRLKEHDDPKYWVEIVKKCAASDFLNGGSKAGWRVTFDWIIENDSNATKILEGAYDSKKTPSENIRDEFLKKGEVV